MNENNAGPLFIPFFLLRFRARENLPIYLPLVKPALWTPCFSTKKKKLCNETRLMIGNVLWPRAKFNSLFSELMVQIMHSEVCNYLKFRRVLHIIECILAN